MFWKDIEQVQLSQWTEYVAVVLLTNKFSFLPNKLVNKSMFMKVVGLLIYFIIHVQASSLLTNMWQCLGGWFTFPPFGNVKI